MSTWQQTANSFVEVGCSVARGPLLKDISSFIEACITDLHQFSNPMRTRMTLK